MEAKAIAPLLGQHCRVQVGDDVYAQGVITGWRTEDDAITRWLGPPIHIVRRVHIDIEGLGTITVHPAAQVSVTDNPRGTPSPPAS